ncbi:hypothetical protein AVEN_201433-1 [Araneus ventricosus]|uniref:Uncharacterized protein n=1 Tax=Araneus ventricosus TaxID=182803 RepID=A0A4Y2M6U8_ARAVE|nr:hypothetical protein AVEN_95170-1 [Araneus ventricosus]GBN22253.1 hypothetical protein AVEN_201433-1 [Araneus ventricosus]
MFKLIFILGYVLNDKEISILFSFMVDFLWLTLPMVALVISADSIQQKINTVRDSSRTTGNNYQEQMDLYSSNTNLNNDRPLVLTGWGMFAVRKPLLLSLAAWLFTCGVIVTQHFSPSSN